MFASKTSVPSILWHSPPNSGLFLQPASVKALLSHQQGLLRRGVGSLVSSEFLETLKPCTEVHLHLIFSLSVSASWLVPTLSVHPCRCLAVVTCQLLSPTQGGSRPPDKTMLKSSASNSWVTSSWGYFSFLSFFCCWLHCTTCGILVPQRD